MSSISFDGVDSASMYDAYYDQADIGVPKRKAVRETVPYMNGSYDFSALGGYVAYEDRELEYTFDFIGDTPPRLTASVMDFVNWLESAYETEIQDSEIVGWHFLGSCHDVKVKYDEYGLSATVEASFVCYPFRIANEPSSVTLPAGTHTVNNAGMPVFAKASGSGTVSIDGGAAQSAGATLNSKLPSGDFAVTVTGGPVTLEWHEEVV